MRPVDSREGSGLVYCRECGGSFTRSAWTVHTHNPNRAGCALTYCTEQAAGFCIHESLPLCGPHLVEHRRSGHQVQVIDGAVCRTCDGGGRVHAQEVGNDPGGQWLRCPHCFGSGYDGELVRYREWEQERRRQASEAQGEHDWQRPASEQAQRAEERKRQLWEQVEQVGEEWERGRREREEREREERERLAREERKQESRERRE